MLKMTRTPRGLYANNGRDVIADDYISAYLSRNGEDGWVTRYYTRAGGVQVAIITDEKQADARVGIAAVMAGADITAIRYTHVRAVAAAVTAETERIRQEMQN